MKRFAIIAAITAGLFWNSGTAFAQYRPHAAHNQTMSGRSTTMTGHLQTNHNHLTPRPVSGYSPQYYSGGAPLGASLFPGLNYSNPSMGNGPVYPSGGIGYPYGGWPRGR